MKGPRHHGAQASVKMLLAADAGRSEARTVKGIPERNGLEAAGHLPRQRERHLDRLRAARADRLRKSPAGVISASFLASWMAGMFVYRRGQNASPSSSWRRTADSTSGLLKPALWTPIAVHVDEAFAFQVTDVNPLRARQHVQHRRRQALMEEIARVLLEPPAGLGRQVALPVFSAVGRGVDIALLSLHAPVFHFGLACHNPYLLKGDGCLFTVRYLPLDRVFKNRA